MKLRTVLLCLVALSASGCAAAAAGATGAAAGIAYTNRGVESDVPVSVSQVDDRARKAFEQMGISTTATSTKHSGAEQKLEGRLGDTEVVVEMKSAGKDATHVEVIAKEGTVSWNKDLAEKVLRRIVKQG